MTSQFGVDTHRVDFLHLGFFQFMYFFYSAHPRVGARRKGAVEIGVRRSFLGSFDTKEILNTYWTMLTGEGKRLFRTLLLRKSTQAVRASIVDG